MAAEDIRALPIDAVAQATRQAQRDGIFAGLSSALVSAILGARLFRLNRNATILCGVVTGIVSGYQFTQGFLATNLARLDAEKARLDKLATEQDASTNF
ncbi:hypothetical protein BD309DRAFT_949068 [Dichomitus squalens]|uniref:Uncharacterized protein n=1 Tax=Dichomitus squalens (strain LYAD-421) TaxID=732165 RepID=R7SJ74_DICSQ|nr:uncharacterized protein DICSQDRAFT_158106 [Dichomitus squalens LYAD-421 SS1]EJF55938.1 hypothetical protein DICSQDRAFT_158106 [Dichomitus squalens LYAD-421 SS1]TBU48728.1 hypothetical protein BD309DRAFT_949068 [Dichomitus squalens]